MQNEEFIEQAHQAINTRDMAGKAILDQMVQHIYWIENGQVKRMEIRTP